MKREARRKARRESNREKDQAYKEAAWLSGKIIKENHDKNR